MLLSNQITKIRRLSIAVVSLIFLSACQFQPLHGDSAIANKAALKNVGVASVNNRVGQQVRNHLLFLMNGGTSSSSKTHEAKLRISFNDKQLAAIAEEEDATSGTVTVRASYDLVDISTGDVVASGVREAIASYDRTGQVFANNRATRDAENRAAKELAEALRVAIASDLSRQ